ncbi:membrane protein (protein CrcB) [Proteus mirabilis]|uniref:Fluoride-specific ion channel n=1 Tax=Proteus mirabilis TaxID=584 RepID=A0A2X2BPF2_PROMI|nr:membrane protein (protein CrcB) [Proteus mirabilis]
MLNIAIAVFIGGGLGSVLRWLISYRLNSLFPHFATGTLVANCIGAFIIAFGIAWFSKAPNIDPIWENHAYHRFLWWLNHLFYFFC